jgi:hypothetical protein
MMTWLLLAGLANAVTPFLGVEFRPFSRQDLVWVDESRTSGTSVGEFDGTARPNLAAFAGVWLRRRVAIVGGLGVAQLSTITRTEDSYRVARWGVVRPSLDVRWAMMPIQDKMPVPWLMLGAYGDIPSARDASDAYTAEEQEAADEAMRTERARLGGVGGRAGVGVDYRLLPGLAIGANFAVGLHRAVYEAQDASTVSSWVTTEAGLLLTFEWPGPEQWGPDAARSVREGKRKSGRSSE